MERRIKVEGRIEREREKGGKRSKEGRIEKEIERRVKGQREVERDK